MKRNFTRFCPAILVFLLILSLFCLGACTSSKTTQSDFYNVGNADFSVTGAQFDQYLLFRFDTTSSAHTLALPSAADIVANLSSPYAGEVLSLVVAADGNNQVTLVAGTNITIKASASSIPGNTTKTMYFELDNISSGSETVTIY